MICYHQNMIRRTLGLTETLRLYPPRPLGGLCQFIEDCTLGGYHVFKGTCLIMNLSKIQNIQESSQIRQNSNQRGFSSTIRMLILRENILNLYHLELVKEHVQEQLLVFKYYIQHQLVSYMHLTFQLHQMNRLICERALNLQI